MYRRDSNEVLVAVSCQSTTGAVSGLVRARHSRPGQSFGAGNGTRSSREIQAGRKRGAGNVPAERDAQLKLEALKARAKAAAAKAGA